MKKNRSQSLITLTWYHKKIKINTMQMTLVRQQIYMVLKACCAGGFSQQMVYEKCAYIR